MIRFGPRHRKQLWHETSWQRVGLILIFGFAPLIPRAAAAQEGARALCAAQDGRLERTIEAERARTTPSWGPLVPEANAVAACFRRAGGIPAATYSRWTYVLVEAHRYDAAEAAFQEFFAGTSGDTDPGVLTRMYRRRGFMLARLQRISESLDAYMQAGILAGRLEPVASADALLEVGERFRLLPDYAEAEAYFDAAEARLRAAPPEAQAEALRAQGYAHVLRAKVALLRAERGDLPAAAAARVARPHLREALRLLPPGRGSLDGLRRTHALMGLMETYRLEGRAAEAEPVAREALALARSLQEPYPVLLGWVELGNGLLLFDRGRLAEARRSFERARARCITGGEVECEMWALLDLGAVAEEEGDVDGAVRFYLAGIDLGETWRRQLGLQAWSASAFVNLQRPYRALVRLLLLQGRGRDAFVILDNTRARYLRDLQALSERQSDLGLDAQARVDSLAERLRAVRRASAAPRLAPDRRSTLNRDAMELEAEIVRESGYAPTRPPNLAIPALQRALGARRQTLLSYFLERDEAFAFVVRADTFAAVRLPAPPDTIRAALAAASRLWRDDGAGGDAGGGGAEGTGTDVDLRALHRLYTLLVGPVRGLIRPGERLAVVPEGPLTRLPFALLVEQPPRPFAYAEADYLVRHHAVTTELSASLFAPSPPRRHAGGELLVLGRTRFRDLPALPLVVDEVEHVGLELPRAHLALNETATEASLERRLSSVRLLHIASHAEADPARPLYSAIELWDDPEDDGDDGTLHLYELAGRRLDADLVVLSGCRTAHGSSFVGEGMLGLQHAFRASGVRSTVATLWNVEDRATGELMVAFYAALRRGLSKDRALQEAQLAYLANHRDDPLRASPFFWAGPVLYGDPTPLPYLATVRLSPVAWYAFGLFLLTCGFAVTRLRRSTAEPSADGGPQTADR